MSSRAIVGSAMWKYGCPVFLISFASGLLCVNSALAQQGTGTIRGRATDTDRSALQGARVELQPKGRTAVSDGQGDFTVGDETRQAGQGVTVWAPAGVPHGVTNPGSVRLVLLVGIAPWK